MTDKQKEAIEILFHLEHINGYVDLYEKNDVIIKSDILLKWKNATKEVLSLIQTQQAEIEKSRNTKDLYYENKELRKLLEKKDEIIVLILKELYKKAHISTKCYLQKSIKECLKHKNCIECLKQYFERKVENGN